MHLRSVGRLLCVIVCLYGSTLAADPINPMQHTYIVQGESAKSTAQAVRQAGGDVQRELSIIKGVSAVLTDQQAQQLSASGLRLTVDKPVAAQVSTSD